MSSTEESTKILTDEGPWKQVSFPAKRQDQVRSRTELVQVTTEHTREVKLHRMSHDTGGKLETSACHICNNEAL